VRNERRQSEGRPYASFWLNANEVLYPKGHPYDHSVIGSHEDLEAASLDDVKDFFATYYTPNNATLCIAGDFDPVQTKQWIEEYYGEIPPGPPIRETEVWIPELTHEKRVRFEDRVQLTRLFYVWHTPPVYRPGNAAMDLAAQILGQGKTSRLYRRLVDETELAQDVSAWQDGRQVASTFTVMITLKPESTIDAVEAILDQELATFRDRGPTAEELDRVRSNHEAGFLKGIQRVGSWGGKSDLLNRYNHYVGTPDYLAQDLARYTNATQRGIQEVFKTYVGPGRVVFEIVPAGKNKAEPPAEIDRAVLPEGEPMPEFWVPEIRREVLDNGLELLVMRQSELPLVQLRLLFRTGSAADPEGRDGLADLTGDLLLAGTDHLDKFEFAEELERLGTDMSVSSTDDVTAIRVSGLTDRLDESMDLLGQVLLHPAFSPEEFRKEKETRLVNIRRESENPWVTAGKVTRRVIFGAESPYGHSRTGTEATMEAITLDDVRRFAGRNYVAGNAVLVAVGDITLEQMESLCRDHFRDWSGSAPPRPEFAASPERTERAVYLVDKPGDSQSTISIGHLGVARNDPDWEKLFLANRILGGFFSSRLNLNIREDKGYSYGTRSRFDGKVHRGAFTMGGRVQTEVTAPALVEFMKEMEGMTGKRPVTRDELEFARSSVLLGYPARFETNGEMAGVLGDIAVYGLAEDYLTAYPKRVAAVSVDDVMAVSRRALHPDKVAVIVVGDLKKIEDPIRKLNLGPIHYLDADGNPIARPGGERTGEE